jgi:hypothetical protein
MQKTSFTHLLFGPLTTSIVSTGTIATTLILFLCLGLFFGIMLAVVAGMVRKTKK